VTDILGRVGNILRANINAMVDSAEDPERMLDQLIRDFTNNIGDAEEAVAATIGNLRMAEEDHQKAHDEADEWGAKARAAAGKASQLETAGNAAEAARFNDLAKTALREQISYEKQAQGMDDTIAQQSKLTDELKDGLNKMRDKREELVHKRDELVARARMAQAERQVQESVQNVNVMDPTSDVARYEERVRREEAMARGMAEVSASSTASQFEQLQDETDDAEVEARLAALKAGDDSASPTAPPAADASGIDENTPAGG
jgi:phage shock protein A